MHVQYERCLGEHCKEEIFVKSDRKVQNWPYTVLQIAPSLLTNNLCISSVRYSANKTETIMLHTGHPFQQLSVTLHHLWVVDLIRRIGSNSVSGEPALTLCVYKSHDLYHVQDSPLAVLLEVKAAHTLIHPVFVTSICCNDEYSDNQHTPMFQFLQHILQANFCTASRRVFSFPR